MNELSRRTLLKCLAALPAARAFGAFTPLHRWASGPRQAAAQSITQLNVLFHGLIGFFVESGKIYGMLADVPGHVFLAGNRNSPIELTRNGSYTLSGVTWQNNLPDFDEKRNPVVRGKFTKNPQKAHSTLVFPYPDKVVPERRIPIKGEPFFKGAHAPQGLEELPSVLVYVYTQTRFDGKELRLGPLSWVPEVHGGVVNLHVYAEPKCTAKNHLSVAFQHVRPPLGNPDVELNPKFPPNYRALLNDPDPAINGVSKEDLMNLDEDGYCNQANPDNCTPMTVIA